MPTPLHAHLEQKIFFPALSANPAHFPENAEKLLTIQESLINLLRTYIYPCRTESALHHALELTKASPNLRQTWTDLIHLGLPSLLDDQEPLRLAA